MNDKSGNLLLFIGILGVIGLTIWAVTRSNSVAASNYQAIFIPQTETSTGPQGVQGITGATGPTGATEVTTYNNTEEITFPDGFDPDTLMPRKIVVHRVALVSK